jgi:hypothetical protein
MGIDLRTKRAGRDRNKYYKANYVNNMKLTKEAEPQGVFYSTDAEPQKKSINVNGSTRHVETRAKIITNDYIPDLNPDDYVLYGGDGLLYIVEEVTSEDIHDAAKPYSRHSSTYVITMRR